MSGAGKVVCVTGASGYIASWLVKLLLEKGYTVKATVRDLKDPKKTAHLLDLEGAKERLRLFEANLTQEGAFDHAVDGCEGVFHTASPVALSVTDPQGELIGPAVQGTLNVLKSCARIPSIRRVVLTSSMAAVVVTGKPLHSNPVIDETWFSDPKICEEAKLWYQVSKTLAEKAAWEFAKENGIDLVTINPGYVIGPLLQPTLNLTSVGMLNLIKSGATSIGFQSDPSKGHELFSDAMHRFVDVRDVASAHIKALDNPTASGRYCLVNQVSYLSETLKILHRLFPDLNLSERYNNDKTPVVPSYQVSKEKAKALGIEFISLEVSLKDAVESFMEKGFLVA